MTLLLIFALNRASPAPCKAAGPAPSPATQPATQPVDVDLILHWNIAHADRNSIADLSNHNHAGQDLSAIGMPKYQATGRLSLVGAQADPKARGLDVTGDYCIVVKFTVEKPLDSTTAIVDKSEPNALDAGFAIFYAPEGGLTFKLAQEVMPTGIHPRPAHTYQIAVTSNRQQRLVYVDGRAISIFNGDPPPRPAVAPLLLGQPGGALTSECMRLPGEILDLRIYHRALSNAEVRRLAAGEELTFAYPTLEPSQRKTVEDLITQLANEDFTIRDKAQKALEKMGRPIRPLLLPHANAPDPETRARIRALVYFVEDDK